jgi:hypothetical protein
MNNYEQLSEAELRTYVKTDPDDEEAFQYYWIFRTCYAKNVCE